MAASLTFSKTSYSPTEQIDFTVHVDEAMESTVNFSGTVELPDGTVLPETGSTTVDGIYGPFTAPGYTVVQDAVDPATFHATPAA